MARRKKVLTLSEQLRTKIHASKLSPYELCEASNVSRSVLSRFLTGKRTITLETADRLAEILELRLADR